jgi:hypothetical protein
MDQDSIVRSMTGEYHWVCVLNPGETTTFERLELLLREPYDRAVERYARVCHDGDDPRTSS